MKNSSQVDRATPLSVVMATSGQTQTDSTKDFIDQTEPESPDQLISRGTLVR